MPDTAIIPTVGRRVWFYRDQFQLEPIDAGIIKVHDTSETLGPLTPVNLDVCDPDTGHHSIERFVQPGDESTTMPHYRWMPYQKGQAAKA